MPIPQVHQNPEIHKKLNKQFSDYLEEIVRKIRLGKVFQCNTSKGISLDKIFQAVLVEREFTFYAGYDFYAGTRLNLLDDTQVKNGENSAPVRKKVKNLFMLPGIPDPIPLPIALVTDWRSNQASVKNEKILAIYGMQPSARPGRMPKKAIEKTDDTFHTDCLREKSEHFLELFDRIRFLDNREWEYFPAFFCFSFFKL